MCEREREKKRGVMGRKLNIDIEGNNLKEEKGRQGGL